MKKWKKVSAAVLAAGLVTSSAGQVWANDTDKVDSSKVAITDLQQALENVKGQDVSAKDLDVISSIVPAGYTANNIFALSKNLEKVSNPKAKAALQKNIDKALAKWAEKNKVETEAPVEAEPEAPVEQPEVPVAQPEAPFEQPEVPVEQPEAPAEQPEAPVAQPEAPVEQPDVPVEETETSLETSTDETPVVEAPVTKVNKGTEKKAAALAKAAEKKAAGQAKAEAKKAETAEKSSKGKKDKE